VGRFKVARVEQMQIFLHVLEQIIRLDITTKRIRINSGGVSSASACWRIFGVSIPLAQNRCIDSVGVEPALARWRGTDVSPLAYFHRVSPAFSFDRPFIRKTIFENIYS